MLIEKQENPEMQASQICYEPLVTEGASARQHCEHTSSQTPGIFFGNWVVLKYFWGATEGP